MVLSRIPVHSLVTPINKLMMLAEMVDVNVAYKSK